MVRKTGMGRDTGMGRNAGMERNPGMERNAGMERNPGMERNAGMERKRFLASAAGVALAGVAGGALSATGAAAAGRGSPGATDGAGAATGAETAGHAHGRTGEDRTGKGRTGKGRTAATRHGVCYEVKDGEHPETGWQAARMRKDLRAIRDDLRANSVSVFGDGVERLSATAEEAARLGLRVWLQPRLADRPHAEILDHLAETGRYAERLRRQGARVALSVGCEFVLFVPGIVPGADVFERIRNLTEGTYDPQRMVRRLTAFTARAARTGRSVFHGPLTYGAAEDDEVDWSLFDLVSVNYYGDHQDVAGHVDALRPYQRWGKPVVVSEFGTCTYRGAPQDGGMGWDNVDYTKDPPEIAEGLVRSERTQATYLSNVLTAVDTLGLHTALAYTFVEPDAPHRPADPRHDLDTVSYALAAPLWKTPGHPTPTWHWRPKQSFHTLATHYRSTTTPTA